MWQLLWAFTPHETNILIQTAPFFTKECKMYTQEFFFSIKKCNPERLTNKKLRRIICTCVWVPNDQPATNFSTKMSVRPSQELCGTREVLKWLLGTEGTAELYFGNKWALIFNLHFLTLGEYDSVEKVAKKDSKKIKESRLCCSYAAPCKWNP